MGVIAGYGSHIILDFQTPRGAITDLSAHLAAQVSIDRSSRISWWNLLGLYT